MKGRTGCAWSLVLVEDSEHLTSYVAPSASSLSPCQPHLCLSLQGEAQNYIHNFSGHFYLRRLLFLQNIFLPLIHLLSARLSTQPLHQLSDPAFSRAYSLESRHTTHLRNDRRCSRRQRRFLQQWFSPRDYQDQYGAYSCAVVLHPQPDISGAILLTTFTVFSDSLLTLM